MTKSMFFLSLCMSCSSWCNAIQADSAKAVLQSKSGSKAKGEVHFREDLGGLKISYDIRGLESKQSHGFHIHEKGDCSSSDAKSAGSHYLEIAPAGGTALDSPEKHAGDFPPLKANGKGIAKGSFIVPHLSITKDNSVLNKAIIVHGGPDDPEKNAPPRIACGVITATQ